MSAEALKAAVIAEIEKEATETAQATLDLAIQSLTVDRIAIQVAYLKGIAIALQKSALIVNSAYKNIMTPEKKEDTKPLKKELY